MFPLDTKILIVDDMKTMRILVKKCLTAMGFTNITEAEDGEAAYKLVELSLSEMKPFKLVISDWTMPKMTGLEFLQKIRADAKTSALPFVLLTAEADSAQIKQAIAAGVSNYITKPYTPDILKAKILQVWDRLQQKKSA